MKPAAEAAAKDRPLTAETVEAFGAAVLEDFKDRLLVAFGGEWSVGFLTKHNPGLILADALSVS